MSTLQLTAWKALVRTVGRLSDGVRIAREHGLTSGTMLDYVYRNQPSGRLWVGRLLDGIYLGHPAWEAVRIRRRNLEGLLERAIRRQLADGGKILVLDVAAGPAGYVQDVLARLPGEPVEALCWDLDERWLAEGRRQAAARGLGNIRYEHGNALDVTCFLRLHRRPAVLVASGFYDWMENDRTIRRSMAIACRALADGGSFLFTTQTGHANLRMVNGTFRGFDGEPLRMTTRPLAAVHDWARQAGFDVLDSASDAWGYHAVTLAGRR